MILLDTNDPNQVDNPRVIEATLEQANRKMMIFSGTARPEWRVNDDEHTYREDVTVNLRRTVLAVEQATVAVGVATFGNNDTVFIIATDSARVDIDPVSQELLLQVSIALQGEDTSLNRFGYQVVAIVTTQSTGISGTIRWARNMFDGTHATSGQIAQMFEITANYVERIVPAQGFSFDRYTPRAYGVPTGLASDKNDFIVPYEIPGAPYNQPLVVMVAVGPLFPTSHSPNAWQIAGPNPVVLTLGVPGVTGVDFRVTAPPVIK